MDAKEYVASIMRKIKLPTSQKKHIKKDLENNISDEFEKSIDFSETQKNMGTPAQISSRILKLYVSKYNHKISLLRYVYLIFAAIPLVYSLFIFARIHILPTPGGFPTAKHFINDLFVNYSPTIVLLTINLLLHLLICYFGYTIFEKQLFLNRKYIFIMLIIEAVVAAFLHPSLLGVEIIYFSNSTSVIKSFLFGFMQPQLILALATIFITLLFYMKKAPSKNSILS